MTVAAFNPEHYTSVVGLWRARAFPPLPPEALPPTGCCIMKGNCLIAAGFLYLSDSTIAWTEWLTTNPDAAAQERHEALDLIIEYLETSARAAGRRILFVSLADAGLIKRFTSHGFAVSDSQMTNLIKVL
jgi:hypothetical protein